MKQRFDLEKLIVDVFAPQAGEKVLVMVDLPHGDFSDHDRWRERRKMAQEWHSAFQLLGGRQGFSVFPLLTYPATGANNADLGAGRSLPRLSGGGRQATLPRVQFGPYGRGAGAVLYGP